MPGNLLLFSVSLQVGQNGIKEGILFKFENLVLWNLLEIICSACNSFKE
jgi:hypothetical protein